MSVQTYGGEPEDSWLSSQYVDSLTTPPGQRDAQQSKLWAVATNAPLADFLPWHNSHVKLIVLPFSWAQCNACPDISLNRAFVGTCAAAQG